MGRRRHIANGLGLVLATGIFVAVGIGMLWGVQQFIADARYVSHTNAVIAGIDAFEARLRDTESAQRGYLLTGDVAYLADYRLGLEQLAPSLQYVQQLVADNAQQLAHIAQLRQLAQLRSEQLDSNLARYQNGGLDVAREGINNDVFEASSQIRRITHAMLEHEAALLVKRGENSERSAFVLRSLVLLGIPLGIVLLGVVYARLAHEVRRRGLAEHRTEEAKLHLQQSLATVERHSASMGALNRYANLLQNCQTVEEAVALTPPLLSTVVHGSAGTLYRIRASRDYAEALVHWGDQHLVSAPMVAPVDCWGLRRGTAHLNPVADPATRCHHWQLAGTATPLQTACIPLSAQGVQLGFIALEVDAVLMEEQLALLQAAAEQLAMTLHTLSLQEKLRVQSIRDPLTGLFNRRYLEESLARELARAERHQQPVCLMMLDVDHFKAFNDTHGHPGGDALLAALGTLLQQHVRAEDIACRYGGEEFTLILPETTQEAALVQAERLLAAIRAMRVMHLGHELPAVTASVGLAECHAGTTSVEHLLQRADSALYRAKREGRDRVVVDATI